jgi:hypothetical protein
MNKRELFIASMHAGHYKRLAWVVSAFSITRESENAYKADPYPYRLVQTQTGVFYCDPTKAGELVKIEDAPAGEPPYRFRDPIELSPTDCPNLASSLASTYGDLLFNWCVLVYSFGTKMAFQAGPIKINKLEKMILVRFEDTPPEGAVRKDDTFYVDEYLLFAKALYYLTGFTQLCVWAATAKTMTAPPGIVEYRAKLLQDNAGTLNQMATIAKIDKALVDYDNEWLKDDPGGKYFMSSNKSRNIVRKKLFLMHGAEMSLDNNTVNAKLITNSLGEGWDVSKFPDMNNSLRAGSFNRGAETVLGGVSVKWLLRASSNLNVTEDDCGARLGGVTDVTVANQHKLVGFSVITDKGSERILTLEKAGTYLGQRLMMRNPMYCKLTLTDYCKVCLGERLIVNPTALSIAVAAYGSSFLYIFLSGAHAKSLILAKMDLNTAIT